MPWILSNPYGILVDEEADAWHTGAVTAVLPVENTQDLLIGGETGGVWRGSPADVAATALSDAWSDPDITALIQTPDPAVVVATTGKGSVYLSDLPSSGGSAPLGTFRQARTVDGGGAPVTPGRIWAGVVEPTTQRLVLACQNGLFWAELPLAGDDLVFAAAVGAAGPFSGVALGPATSIIAAGYGPALSGLFLGTWTRTPTGGSLLRVKPVRPALINGVSIGRMGRTSVASCAGSPRFAFAVTAEASGANKNSFYAVLRSLDGGQSWNVCGQLGAFANAGNQADRNEAIAVTPQAGASSYQQLNVAMGMRRGPFISNDGGDNWVEHGDTGSGSGKSPHLHSDTRCLLFDDRDSSGNTLYVGSDGGVACTRDLGASWETRPFNSRLPILQFCGSNRGYRGGASAAPTAEIAGGGLQDNENVCASLWPQPAAWRALDAGGDGGYVCFVRRDSWGNQPQSGVAISCNANAGRALELTEWVGQQLSSRGVISVKAAGGYPAQPSGVAAAAGQYVSLSTVAHPAWPDRHRRVISVCGSGSIVYGFVQTGGIYGTWLRLASVPLKGGEFITAVGSRTGDPIYVGTSNGSLFAVDPNEDDPDQATILELQIKIGRAARATLGDTKLILHAEEDLVLAAYDRQLLTMEVLHFRPVKQLPVNEPLTGLAYDERSEVVFASFDGGVFQSTTAGDSWQPFSQSLPKMAHAAELFVGESPAGQSLYLATWGRSLYHCDL